MRPIPTETLDYAEEDCGLDVRWDLEQGGERLSVLVHCWTDLLGELGGERYEAEREGRAARWTGQERWTCPRRSSYECGLRPVKSRDGASF